MAKYIFVSGGVISGLGKGITTASLSAILEAKGYKISPMKVDMYLNLDAGTIRPSEHGEVFVTTDGLETDQDLGNYERFIGRELHRVNYLTTGQVYAEVLRKERAFEYEGEDVEAIPHVTDEILKRFKAAGEGADIVIVELGGTVGEYQNAIFFEATRILRMREPHNVLQIHVAYLPIPGNLGEMKTKPVQQSVRMLNSMGIQPDIIVGRSEVPMDDRRKERVALFCNVAKEEVISNPDCESIYEIPLILEEQKLGDIVLKKFGLKSPATKIEPWKKLVKTIKEATSEAKIAVVGKYFGTGDYMLSDVYISVIEAIKHAAWAVGRKPVLTWIDSKELENMERSKSAEVLKGFDGLVVPGGFGQRGVEGIIEAIRYARENKIPYLGLCYGMQLASIEFARNVCGITGAHTTEIEPNASQPIIHIMPEQAKKLLKQDYGGTMRLGSWPCKIKKGTHSHEAYGSDLIHERHRHRYEFNNAYREQLEKAGLVIAGTTPDGQLVEIIELADHPFFVASQFHPEFQSSPLKPHPLFYAFTKAIVEGRK
ncbi:MAG: CTP synthetase [Candidatus Giovannonibacteria bacterium GW2011_GWA2_53_7]|uniref:CTP synthase n=1 Tax=Candidatus Giovannonibacteria bacterium GW2011_GWA2_53_7 TaxID=1618650 RepID=A0A0G2A7T4_9BACT|nr:MAG: CTP synthetase [Candidatus Giovannonibacteria bacterium GW2011_GWA2_53_7]